MKEEYDFSKAERGKFYRAGAPLIPPVHLEPDVLITLTGVAETRGVSLDQLVNDLLKEDIKRFDKSA